MRRRPETPTAATARKFGNAGEAGVLKRGGYRSTAASGSKAEKGDLRRGEWMVEVKTTSAESFRVTSEAMAKLRNDGLTNGKPGALVVNLGDGTKVAVMDLKHFERLTDADQV